MPYIERERRNRLGFDLGTARIRGPGELSYLITMLVNEYLPESPRYGDFNEVIGVLECAKLELYRRIVAPYEDKKIEENGDVYRADLMACDKEIEHGV